MAMRQLRQWLQVFPGNPDSASLLAAISFSNTSCVDSNDADAPVGADAHKNALLVYNMQASLAAVEVWSWKSLHIFQTRF